MKQFKNTGFWKCSIEEFRYLLDIPEHYKMINIDNWSVSQKFRLLLSNFFVSFFYGFLLTSLVHNQIPFLNYILTNRKLVFNLFVQGLGTLQFLLLKTSFYKNDIFNLHSF